jgi:hypothetical protein
MATGLSSSAVFACKSLSLLGFIVFVVLFCAVTYFLFSKRDEIFFQFNFDSVGKVEALLQTLGCAWVCAAFKCALTIALVYILS